MEFWNSWLTDLKLQKYAKLLKDNNLEESDLAHFNHELLRSVGIDNAKDRLRILHKKKVTSCFLKITVSLKNGAV